MARVSCTKVFAAVAAIAVLAIAVLALLPDGGPDGPGPEEHEPIPDRYTYDPATMVLKADRVQTWHIRDLHHAFLDVDGLEYTGYTVPDTDRVVLEPGRYEVTADGDTDVMQLGDTLVRTVGWDYSSGGLVHAMSVDVSIDIGEFAASSGRSSSFNTDNRNDSYSGYLFRGLPCLVETGDCIRGLESDLRKAYLEIGGSPDDRQSYADFLAGFVQMSVEYPQRLSGHGEDYAVWGHDEYWCTPLETLYHMVGDCEDKAALLCSLYDAAGYGYAMGGHSGHVFAGVRIDGYRLPDAETVSGLADRGLSECSDRGILSYSMAPYEGHGSLRTEPPVEKSDTVYMAVETIRGQVPVGFLAGGMEHLDRETPHWGWAGFYTDETKVTLPGEHRA